MLRVSVVDIGVGVQRQAQFPNFSHDHEPRTKNRSSRYDIVHVVHVLVHIIVNDSSIMFHSFDTLSTFHKDILFSSAPFNQKEVSALVHERSHYLNSTPSTTRTVPPVRLYLVPTARMVLHLYLQVSRRVSPCA